jgi:hypothetical protein
MDVSSCDYLSLETFRVFRVFSDFRTDQPSDDALGFPDTPVGIHCRVYLSGVAL